MIYEGIKENLKSFLLEKTFAILSVENVREICQKAVNFAKEAASETKNPLDDWAVECLQMIVNDDEKIQRICDFIKLKLAGNLCESTSGNDTEELMKTLSNGLNPVGPSTEACDGLGTMNVVTDLLSKIIIPLLIEWLNGKLNDH